MKVSIIVSDMDSQGMISVNMLALCTQDFPKEEFEVILPDLGNFTKEDKTLLHEFVKQYSNFSIIETKGQTRSELFNVASKRAKGDLLLFIESHIFVKKEWVKEYVDLFNDAAIQMVQGEIQTVPSKSWVGPIRLAV